MTQRLFEKGAAVVAFDLIFPEPDRTSPKRYSKSFAESLGIELTPEQRENLVDHDQQLAALWSQVPVVSGNVLTADPREAPPEKRWGIGFAGDDPLPFLPSFQGAVKNIDVLEDAAAGHGFLNAAPGPDGKNRSIMLFARVGDEILPSLTMEALRLAQGAQTYLLKASGASGIESFGRSSGLDSIKNGQFEIPTDANGRFWIHFAGYQPERYISAIDVLDESASAEALAGHIVLIGSSAAGLKDQRATPLDPAAPGVEVHAEALEQILLGFHLTRPGWSDGAELLYILFVGLLLIALIPRLGPLLCASVGSLTVLAVAGGSWWVFIEYHQLFDPFTPCAGVFVVYLTATIIGFVRTELDRNRTRAAFGQYLSPDLVSHLAEHPEELKLGGENRDISILFADIRGFTTFCEGKTPEEITGMLNRFLTPVTADALSEQGTIDKYVGDQIMAFWNAPLPVPDHADRACRAALKMRASLKALNEELEQGAREANSLFKPLRIGIGIGSGPCLVGNMGSDQRFNYSALGDAVNEASRIEGQTKLFGTDILIGEETAERLEGEFALIPLGAVRLVGLTRATKINALIGDDVMARQANFVAWREANQAFLDAFEKGDPQTMKQTLERAKAAAGFKHRALYKPYETFLFDLTHQDKQPAESWTPVLVAQQK